MNRLLARPKTCVPSLFGREAAGLDPARGAPSAEAEAAAFCAMKLAEAERQARDGRGAVCCG